MADDTFTPPPLESEVKAEDTSFTPPPLESEEKSSFTPPPLTAEQKASGFTPPAKALEEGPGTLMDALGRFVINANTAAANIAGGVESLVGVDTDGERTVRAIDNAALQGAGGFVNPALDKTVTAQVATALGQGAPAIALGVTRGAPGLIAGTLASGAQAYQETKSQALDEGKSDDDANLAGLEAAGKSALEMGAFLGTAKVAAKVAAPFLPANALARGAVSAGVAATANTAATEGIKAVEGEDLTPTVGDITQIGLFSILHGIGEATVPTQVAKAAEAQQQVQGVLRNADDQYARGLMSDEDHSQITQALQPTLDGLNSFLEKPEHQKILETQQEEQQRQDVVAAAEKSLADERAQASQVGVATESAIGESQNTSDRFTTSENQEFIRNPETGDFETTSEPLANSEANTQAEEEYNEEPQYHAAVDTPDEIQPAASDEEMAEILGMGNATQREFQQRRAVLGADIFNGLAGANQEAPNFDTWKRNFDRALFGNPEDSDLSPQDYQTFYDLSSQAHDAFQASEGRRPMPEVVDQIFNPNRPETQAGAESAAAGGQAALKNADMQRARREQGLPEVEQAARKADPQLWSQTSREIADDPQLPDRLIEELKASPRAVNDEEGAVLLHRKILLDNQFAANARVLQRAQEAGDEEGLEQAKLRRDILSQQLSDIHQVVKRVGTETARGLRFRQVFSMNDYTLANMTARRMAANDGKPLTPEQQKQVQEAHDRIQKATAAEQTLQEKRASGWSQMTFEDLMKEAASESAKFVPSDLDRARDRLTSALKGGRSLEDSSSLVRRLAKEIVRSGVTDRNELVDRVHAELKKVLPEVTRRETQDAISGYGKYRQLSKDEVDVRLRDLSGQLQQVSKLLDMEAGNAPSKTGQEKRPVSDEERRLIQQVREEMKKGGYVVTDPDRQLRTAVQAITARLKNQISDLTHEIETRKRTLKTKGETPTSPEIEALRRRRDELQKVHDEVFADQNHADRLTKAVVAARKNLAEYERRLAEKDIAKRPGALQGPPNSPELVALRGKIEEAKQRLQELRDLANPKKTPQEIRLQAFKSRLRGQISDLQERLAAGDFAPKARPEKPVFDKEAEALASEKARLQNEFDQKVEEDRLKNRSLAEKAREGYIAFRRWSALSSLAILSKLGKYNAIKLVTSPLEEGVGRVLARIPGISRIAEQAPRHGGAGGLLETEMAAAKHFVDNLASEIRSTLKTGQMTQDFKEGQATHKPIGPGALAKAQYLTHLHAALHTPAALQEFGRSLAIRTAWAKNHGIDTSDELVRQQLLHDAYGDMQTARFLQQNRYANVLGAMVRTLSSPNKGAKQNALAKSFATLLESETPVKKIPFNVLSEGFEYLTGLLLGSAKAAKVLWKGAEVSHDEADYIMQLLKKGAVGAAAAGLGWVLANKIGGYFVPDQQKEKRGTLRPGAVATGDETVNRLLGHDALHAPLFEPLLWAATMRRIAESKLNKKDREKQGYGAGLMSATLGTVQDAPGMEFVQHISEAYNAHQRGALLGNEVRSQIPSLLTSTASQGLPFSGVLNAEKLPPGVLRQIVAGDVDANGEPIRRQTKSIGDYVKSAIPVARETLPQKR